MDRTDEVTESVSRDVVFTVLSNRRRRLVLRYLRTVEPTVEIRDLARWVAAEENDIPASELTYKQRKRVYTSLHQTHLPKLDDAEFITYDRDRGRVTVEPLAATLEPYLSGERGPSRPWYRYYLILGVVAFGAAALAAAGVAPLDAVPPEGWGLLTALVVTGLALAHAVVNGDRSGDDD